MSLLLDANAPIMLDDGEYFYAQQSGNLVRLRNSTTGQYVDMTLGELANRKTDKFAAPPQTSQAQTARTEDQKRALFWGNHIEELLTGVHPNKKRTNPAYDPSRTQNERVAAKVAELNAAGLPASRASLMKKISIYRDAGWTGLIDGRKVRSDTHMPGLDPRVKAALCEVIANNTDLSTGTKSRIVVKTQVELLSLYGKDAPPLPSRASMYRYIDAFDSGVGVTGSARTRQSENNRPKRTFGSRKEVLLGAQVQVDSTTMDVLVKRPGHKRGSRPTLTIMLDVCSNSIIAFTLRFDAAKGFDHAVLLAQALTPPENRPDREFTRYQTQLANPQITLIDPERRRELIRTRAFIRPQRVMMDNGNDFAGGVFRAAAAAHGIDITLSAPHTPTDKPNVERTFGSINSLFTQYLPGYTGRSPEHRGRNVHEEDLLDISGLYELFDDWVMESWQNRPHRGNTDPADPSVRLSPNQMVAAASKVTSMLYLPLTEHHYIELLPSVYRVIGTDGVDIDLREYDSPGLHPFRGTKSTLVAKDRKWEFKVDPYNTQCIWMHTPDDTWIRCDLRHANPNRPHLEAAEPSDRELLAREHAAHDGLTLPPTGPTEDELDAASDDYRPSFPSGNFQDDDSED